MLASIPAFPSLSPLLGVAIGSLVVLGTEPFLARDAKHKVLPWIAAIALVVSALLTSLTQEGTIHGLLALDPVRVLLLLVVLVSALLGVAGLQTSLAKDRYPGGEGYALLLLSTVGTMTMVLSTDMLALFVGMELSAIPLYALVALRRDSLTPQEGAYKYFVHGGLFGAVFLYGAALWYGATGSTSFYAPALEGRETLRYAGAVLAIAALLFKSGAAPFHFWVADAYSGASLPVTGFMGATVKVGAVAALGALWLGLAGVVTGVPSFADHIVVADSASRVAIGLGLVGVLSIAIGAFSGLAQKRARRMMAFSAVVNAGYLMLALLATGVFTGGSLSLSTASYYLAAYALASSLVMAGVSLLAGAGEEDDEYGSLRGAGRRAPLVGVAVSLGLASLAGLPPVAGFLAKFQVLAGLVAGGMTWIAALGLVLAVVAAAYYLKLGAVLWADEKRQDETVHGDSSDTPDPLLAVSLVLGSLLLITLTAVPRLFG